MPVPDFQSLMRPVLASAAARPVRMPEVAGPIGDAFKLNDDDRAELLPSGRQPLFYNRLAWAKFHLSKAGMLASPSRGLFVATADGKRLLKSAAERIDMNVLRSASPAYAKMIARTQRAAVTNDVVQAGSVTSATPNDQIADAVTLLLEKLKDDLREQIMAAGPNRFEQLIRDLLVAMGYGHDPDAERGRRGGSDGGMDGVISQDKLELDRIYLQAKLYTEKKVDRPTVQSFVGSLRGERASKGVFVTMTSFTKEARGYADGLNERVVLIDGDRLCDLLIEHGVGVRDEKPIILKQVDLNYFSDEG